MKDPLRVKVREIAITKGRRLRLSEFDTQPGDDLPTQVERAALRDADHPSNAARDALLAGNLDAASAEQKPE